MASAPGLWSERMKPRTASGSSTSIEKAAEVLRVEVLLQVQSFQSHWWLASSRLRFTLSTLGFAATSLNIMILIA
jgi:hypothetical protein